MDVAAPYLQQRKQKTKRQILSFGGLNLSDKASDGELVSCKNLSARRYPYLTQRPGRTRSGTYNNANAVFSWDGKQVVVDGSNLYFDGALVGSVDAGEKQFAVVNTKLIIWPDKKYLDLTNSECHTMDGKIVTGASSTTVFTADGVKVSVDVYAAISPQYTEMRCWSSTNKENENYCVRKCTAAAWVNGAWSLTGLDETVLMRNLAVGDLVMLRDTGISGSYVLNTKLTATDYKGNALPDVPYGTDNGDGYYGVVTAKSAEMISLGAPQEYYREMKLTVNIRNAKDAVPVFTGNYRMGDKVKISGCTANPGNNTKENTYLTVTGVADDTLRFGANTFTAGSETVPITIQRDIPDFHFICEKDNRLWGASNSQAGMVWNADKQGFTEVTSRVICASALGDPLNFWTFDGISTDSYQAAVANEGDFTACCAFGSGVLFWKDNELCKILGSYPAEYAMYTYHIAGVQKGSNKSLMNINETLFYKGTNGVYAYSGGTPTLISDVFGNHRYAGGAAGTDGIRYYISMREGTVYSLFSYDTQTGSWLREDETHAVDFCSAGGVLTVLSGGRLYDMNAEDNAKIPWSAQFTPFYEQVHNKKTYSRILLRMELDGWVKVEIRMDGGRWESAANLKSGKTVTVPIRPKRCDRFDLRLSGEGTCTLRSMVREFQAGSEV